MITNNIITANINNTIITNNFDNINLESLEIGQQIFLLEEKEDENTERIYSDLTAYCLKDKPLDNLYSFNKIKSNFDIYIDDNNVADMDCAYKKEIIDYLKIDNVTVPLTGYDDIEDFWEDEKRQLFSELDNTVNVSEQITSDKKTNEYYHNGIKKLTEIYKVNYRATINLCYCNLGINIDYTFNINKFTFAKRIQLFLYNEQLKKYLAINMDDKGINKLIKALNEKFKENEIQNCINHLLICNCNIDTFRYNENIQQITFKTFKDIDFGDNTIETIMNNFIYPYYQDIELDLKAYVKNFAPYFSHSPKFLCPYKYEYSDNRGTRETVKNFKYKAESTLEYVLGESYINIYTGEILDRDAFEVYRDAELLNININNEKAFYKKIDDIYVRIQDHYELEDIKQLIKERTTICNLLSK